MWTYDRYGWACVLFFFFQAEDGIRDYKVTGVQTCALPILCRRRRTEGTADLRAMDGRRRRNVPGHSARRGPGRRPLVARREADRLHDVRPEIGRASCRERV